MSEEIIEETTPATPVVETPAEEVAEVVEEAEVVEAPDEEAAA